MHEIDAGGRWGDGEDRRVGRGRDHAAVEQQRQRADAGRPQHQHHALAGLHRRIEHDRYRVPGRRADAGQDVDLVADRGTAPAD